MAEAERHSEHIRSLIVPLAQDYALLLPGAVIAEVVAYQEADAIAGLEEHDQWLLGRIAWRGLEVPLLSVEGLMLGDSGTNGPRSRIVILKAVGNRPGLQYFGICAERIPRLVTVQEGAIEPLDRLEELPGIQAQVLANGEPALIPDIEGIEERLYRVLQETR